MAKAGLERYAVAIVGIAILAAIVFPIVRQLSSVVAFLTVCGLFLLSVWIAPKLPKSLEGGLRRHPVLSVLWLLTALLAILQVGRLLVARFQRYIVARFPCYA